MGAPTMTVQDSNAVEEYRQNKLMKRIPAFLKNATLGRHSWSEKNALKTTSSPNKFVDANSNNNNNNNNNNINNTSTTTFTGV